MRTKDFEKISKSLFGALMIGKSKSIFHDQIQNFPVLDIQFRSNFMLFAFLYRIQID